MKKIFNTSVCILLAALCIQPVYAKTDMPSACPAVAALATVGVHVAGSLSPALWYAGESRNRYGTNVEWSFVMEGIEADTSEAALSIAETNINSMVLIHASSDVKEDGKRTWYCIYAHISHPTIRAAAISPIIDIQKTRKKI